jgi:hypothetical protein
MPDQTLAISEDLSLPLNIAADSLGIFARKGMGKTYTGSVIVEELLDIGIPVTILDPQGDWWGLRSSVDGKGAGYPVVILGGEHADAPLDPTSGREIADFVLHDRIPTVLDLSEFDTRSQEIRFGTDFLDRLFRGKKRGTGTIYVVVDEASTFAPQFVRGEDAKLEGAARNIARKGRTRGLGSLFLDQRPAGVNTNVRSQFGGLVIGGITGPHDKKAIKEWVDAKGEDETRMKVMLDDLPSLKKGSGNQWVWIPDLDVFQRVKIRPRRTFDSSRTPEPGQTIEEPERWASIDLDALGQRLASTIEKARAEDPEVLKREVTALKRQVAELEKRPAVTEKVIVPEKVEIPIFSPQQLEKIGDLSDVVRRAIDKQESALRQITTIGETAKAAMTWAGPDTSIPTPPKPADTVVKTRQASVGPPMAHTIIKLLANRDFTMQQIAIALGLSARGGAWNTTWKFLRDENAVEAEQGVIHLAPDGKALALIARLEPKPVPSLEEIVSLWIRKLPSAAGGCLQIAVENYPSPVSKEECARSLGLKAHGGSWNTAMKKLRDSGTVDVDKTELRASEDLMVFA